VRAVRVRPARADAAGAVPGVRVRHRRIRPCPRPPHRAVAAARPRLGKARAGRGVAVDRRGGAGGRGGDCAYGLAIPALPERATLNDAGAHRPPCGGGVVVGAGVGVGMETHRAGAAAATGRRRCEGRRRRASSADGVPVDAVRVGVGHLVQRIRTRRALTGPAAAITCVRSGGCHCAPMPGRAALPPRPLPGRSYRSADACARDSRQRYLQVGISRPQFTRDAVRAAGLSRWNSMAV
jgi:hypothetical protein